MTQAKNYSILQFNVPLFTLLKALTIISVVIAAPLVIFGTYRFILAKYLYHEFLKDLSNMENRVEELMSLQKNYDTEINLLLLQNKMTERSVTNPNELLNENLFNKIASWNGSKVLNGLFPSKPVILPSKYILPHLNGESELTFSYCYTKRKTKLDSIFGMIIDNSVDKIQLEASLNTFVKKIVSKDIINASIVVLIGETNLDDIFKIAAYIEIHFEKYLKLGLIEVIAPSSTYYPEDLKELLKFNKRKEIYMMEANISRVVNIQRNLDFIFLASFAKIAASNFIYVKPDILVEPIFLMNTYNFSRTFKKYKGNWWSLDFKQFRNVAHKENWWSLDFKTFRNVDLVAYFFDSAKLPPFIEFICLFYNKQPLEMLFNYFRKTKKCDHERKNEEDV